ncbi:hypothetical protein HMI56_005790 [Coelomomyces lativittatus]|nr:hypothetical protein HMI56_005790 [Coelomomyces lativittatus]
MQESIDLLISNPPLKSPPPPTSSSSSLTWGRTFKAAISKLIRPLTPASTPKTALKKNCKNLGVTSFKKKFKMTFFVCCCKIE